MEQRIIDRKTWHEKLTVSEQFQLGELGARELWRECFHDDLISGECKSFEDFCHQIIVKANIPDELSFNAVVRIMNNYLQDRWEEYKNGKNRLTV